MRKQNFAWLIFPPLAIGGAAVWCMVLCLLAGMLFPIEESTTEDMVASGADQERLNRFVANIACFNFFLFQVMPEDFLSVLQAEREWRKWQEQVLGRLPRDGTIYRVDYIYCEAGFFEKLQHFYQMPAPCRKTFIASHEWRTESNHQCDSFSEAMDSRLFLFSLYCLTLIGSYSMLILQRRHTVTEELLMINLLWLPGCGLLLLDVFPLACCTMGRILGLDVAFIWFRSMLPWLGYWGSLHLILRIVDRKKSKAKGGVM